jgi:hypothetical protein
LVEDNVTIFCYCNKYGLSLCNKSDVTNGLYVTKEEGCNMDDVTRWLDVLRGHYTIKEIEGYCGMPSRTVQPGRSIPEKYLDKLEEMYRGIEGVPVERVLPEKKEDDRIYVLTSHRVHGRLTFDNNWDGSKFVPDRSLKLRDQFVDIDTGETYYQMRLWGTGVLVLGNFRDDGLFVSERKALRAGQKFRKIK